MRLDFSPYTHVFKSPGIALMLFMGFSSGLPLALTGGTLQAWMTVAGVDIRTIGVFSLVGLPYTIKFLWSPLMDRFVPPYLGRRRGWMLTMQGCLIIGIAAMGFSDPGQAPFTIAAFALFVALSSASQDIVIDAYRTDILKEAERGVGVAIFVMGYRIAMLISGALALILADRLGWRETYFIMAAVMLAGVIATLFAKEPDHQIARPQSLNEAVWGPLRDFFSRENAVVMLLLIVLYKLGDAYAGTLTTAFLIRGMGFSPTEVGTINKGLGLIALIFGALFGGTIMIKLRMFRALLLFGVLQAVSNLSFMLLAWTGKSYAMMVFAVGFENFSGGMGTSALVALLMAMCNKRYSATQYALLSSLAALGRIFVSPTSGFLVESAGWAAFFFITTLTAIPGLWMVLILKDRISEFASGN